MEENPHFDFGREFPEIFPLDEGDPKETCTVDDFLAHTPSNSAGGYCQEFQREEESLSHELRVFWYPKTTTKDINHERYFRSSSNQYPKTTTKDINHERYFRSSSNQYSVMNNPQPSSVQERIMTCLLSADTWFDRGGLVQFWAPCPRSSTGQRKLSVAEQPFGVQNLCNGLRRYRYISFKYESTIVEVGDCTSKPAGPIARAFAGGSPEYIPVECYSKEEFVLRDYALDFCGIRECLVVPVFERDDQYQQHCIGVLEFLAVSRLTDPGGFLLWALEKALKDTNFVVGTGKSHFHECNKKRSANAVIFEVMEKAWQVHKLPLVQLWIPCICDLPNSKVSNGQANTRINITRLFSDFNGYNPTLPKLIYLRYNVTYYVKNGKSLVERAYSQIKTCFSKNINQLGILDYPAIPLTRSCGLAACFAIPLPLIHPALPLSILELFLPSQQQQYSNGNDQQAILLLKELLLTVDQVVSEYDSSPVKQQKATFDVYFSHSEDSFEFFDVYRDGKILDMHKAFGGKLGEEKPFSSSFSDQPLTLVPSDHPNIQDIADTFTQGYINGELHIPLDATRNFEIDQEVGIHDEVYGSEREQQPFPSSPHQPTAGAARVSNIEKDAAPIWTDHPNTQTKPKTPGRRIDSTNMKYQIKYDEFIRQLGKRRKDAAAALNVSETTFKRLCKEHGILRWGKRVDANQIIPWPPTESVVEGGVESVPQSEIPAVSNNGATEEEATEREVTDVDPIPISTMQVKKAAKGGENIDGGYNMTIKATCREDTVKFGFCSNLGMKELRIELAKRFDLMLWKFKIKYEDKEGDETDWIIISCNEDLHFYTDSLKSSGQKIMKLLIDPTLQ